MSDNEFDVIVVGGGAAGVACAAHLVERGVRTLLVAETAEVGHNLRSVMVDGCRATVQHPTWMTTWNGGWWYRLVKELNVAVKFTIDKPFAVRTRSGDTEPMFLPICPSARSLAEVLASLSPIPVGDALGDIERVVQAGLAIPPDELLAMHDVSIDAWMTEIGASDFARFFITTIVANLMGFSAETIATSLSVFGGFGMIRCFVGFEGLCVSFDPDAREGLLIPIARRVEELGGEIRRGQRVERVLIDDGQVRGLRFADGTEVTSSTVALGVGNGRIAAIVDPLPPEYLPSMSYGQDTLQREFGTCTVLNTPILQANLEQMLFVIDDDGSNLIWFVPLHSMQPWVTDGRQVIYCELNLSAKKSAEFADNDAIYAHMHDICEELYPGWKAAIAETKGMEHGHLWTGPLFTGPKMPRDIESINGLWYAGDAGTPHGIGIEAAMGAGYVTASEILTSRSVSS
jgi:phytoene dehydrogenase-like protein